MIKKYGDIISSTVFLVCTVIYYSATFKLNTENISGNALVPRLISCVMGICCLYILVTSCVKLCKEKKLHVNTAVSETKGSPANKLKVILTIIFISVYAVIFPIFGFVISTPIYLTTQIYLLSPKDKRKILRPIILALIFTGFIYVIFTYVFFLLLPTGSFWYGRG